MKSLFKIDRSNYYWSLFLRVAGTYSILDSARQIKYESVTNICVLMRNFLFGMLIGIPTTALAASGAILLAVLPIIDITLFMVTGLTFTVSPEAGEGVGVVLILLSTISMAGTLLYAFIVLFFLWRCVRWTYRTGKRKLYTSHVSTEPPKGPSLFTLWLKSVKEKTCFNIDLEGG